MNILLLSVNNKWAVFLKRSLEKSKQLGGLSTIYLYHKICEKLMISVCHHACVFLTVSFH